MMMHSISYTSVFFLVIASALIHQGTAAKETLIDLDNARVGGFGGPLIKVSEVKGQQTLEIGGMGGASFTTGKHSVIIGGAGIGLVNALDGADNEKLDIGYGGVIFGYTHNPEALVHIDSHLLLGAGGVTAVNSDNATTDTGSFLIAELSTQLELNITEYIELGLGLSYRITSDPDTTGLSNNDLNSPTAYLLFQFGAL